MKKIALATVMLAAFASNTLALSQFLETASLERVALFPAQYAGQILYFDPVTLSNLDKYEGVFSLAVHSNKGKYISPILKSEGLTFVVPYELADSVVEALSGHTEYIARVGCRIEQFEGRYNRLYWIAKIFDVGFYNNGGKVGRIFTLDSVESMLRVAEYGDNGVVEMLIKCCKEQHAKDKVGQTALMLSSKNGHEKVVNQLIKNGADVNAKTIDGETALMYATKNGQSKVVKILQKAGAKQ